MKKFSAVLIIIVIALGWFATITGIGIKGSAAEKMRLGLDMIGGVSVVMEADTDLSGAELKSLMEQVLNFKEIAHEGNRYLMEIGEGGNGAQMVLVDDTTSQDAMQGYGEVHHIAFRVKTREALFAWKDVFDRLGLGNSGHVDRYYFESLYVRIGHILVELATDEPGFMGDEPYETLGESLSLAPFLEEKREYIESVIKPFNTTREA